MHTTLGALLRLVTQSARGFCALALFLLAAPLCAAATTYYVSPSGNDSSPGTQAAPFLTIGKGITASVSGDTVLVEDGTYTGSGDADLDFGGKNITVTSQNGPATTIIDCGGSGDSDPNATLRAFDFYSGETHAVISGLTIKNGYVSSLRGPVSGGGIRVQSGSALTLTNCILANNSAPSGGGISNGGTLTMNGCILTGNNATSGGGITSSGTLTMTNCVIAANNASSAISSSSAATLTNCTVSGNSNHGISNSGAMTLLNDIVYGDLGSEISGGGASESYCDVQGQGGGAGNLNADPLFVSKIVNLSAPYDLHLAPASPCIGAGTASGAPATDITEAARPNPPSMGAYDFFIPYVTPQYVSPSGLDTNDGSQAHPKLTILAAMNATRSGDTVIVEDGTYSGPGNIDLDFEGKNITVTSQNGPATTIIDCGGYYSHGLGSGDHRAFYLHSGETSAVISGLTAQNGYIAGRGLTPAGAGGGMLLDAGVTVQNCVVTNCYAGTGGGGIQIDSAGSGGSARLVNCTVENNTTNDDSGGVGINSGSGGAVSVTGCTISSNEASNGSQTVFCLGGGIVNDASDGGAITLTGCTITDNGGSFGGGVYNDASADGAVTLTNCAITGNLASSNYTFAEGSGVYNGGDGSGTILLTGCTIAGNGGDVFNAGAGGGVFTSSAAMLTNCVIQNNITVLDGGGVYTAGTTTLTNCTLRGNKADSGCGVETATTGTMTLLNDILYGDTVRNINNVDEIEGPGITATYCDIQDGYAGTANINADPLFVNLPTDLHLQPGSPCIGAGTPNGAPTTTIDGVTRPAPPSIGAYEGAQSAVTETTQMLWKGANGACAVWTIALDGSITSTPAYGPIPGWTAQALADGSDGKPRLLWVNANGQCAVWTINPDHSVSSTPAFGPVSGWNVSGLAVGADNQSRLLWKSVTGACAIWTINAANNSVSSTPAFGPIPGWNAAALAVGHDNQTRLLWNSAGGECAVWTINPANASVSSTPAFGPISGWAAKSLAVGGDNLPRLLWSSANGENAVWTIHADSSVTSTPGFGPISGWGVDGLAVGSDNLSRLLWGSSGGEYAVWTVNADSTYASSPGLGPISGWSVAGIAAP